jgi:glycosyltransferase involved in cell wall biosynthesis
MKTVLIRGPLLSNSGYGVHTRQVFKYLLNKNIDLKAQILPWGNTPWYTNRRYFDGLIGEIVDRSNYDSNTKFDVSFQIQLPHEWNANLAEFNIGITAAVETTKANPLWTSVHCEKMDQVIVPSIHAKNSLVNSDITNTPISVVGESYFKELLHEPKKELDLKITTEFNFLTVGMLTGLTPETDRKNLFYLIKWFVEEFKNDQNVGLVIKTSQGRNTSIDRINTQSLLTKLLKELNYNGVPKIYLLHGDLAPKELNALYKHSSIKAFVSLTRGEGFGLPFLEAAVSGLPVIATNWSAHKEFLDNGRWIGLDYKLENVSDKKIDDRIFVRGAQWAQVTEGEFKKKIRKFYDKNTKPFENALILSKILKDFYSEEKINSNYDDLLNTVI